MLPRMSWVWAWSRPLSTHWPESLITRLILQQSCRWKASTAAL